MSSQPTLLPVRKFLRADFAEDPQTLLVCQVAETLRARLQEEAILARLQAGNRPSAKSQDIQDIIAPIAKGLGFVAERKGLFCDTTAPGLRPDFYCSLGDTGILLEVERGGTMTNNRDLTSFWKCHLCAVAHYLFLFVPVTLQHSAKAKSYGVFEPVCRRLGTFFEGPVTYANVRGLFVFGY
jgi:hypothetical protein